MATPIDIATNDFPWHKKGVTSGPFTSGVTLESRLLEKLVPRDSLRVETLASCHLVREFGRVSLQILPPTF